MPTNPILLFSLNGCCSETRVENVGLYFPTQIRTSTNVADQGGLLLAWVVLVTLMIAEQASKQATNNFHFLNTRNGLSSDVQMQRAQLSGGLYGAARWYSDHLHFISICMFCTTHWWDIRSDDHEFHWKTYFRCRIEIMNTHNVPIPVYSHNCLKWYRPKKSRYMIVRDICLYHTLGKSYSRSGAHVDLPKASVAVLLNPFVHIAPINHLKTQTPP